MFPIFYFIFHMTTFYWTTSINFVSVNTNYTNTTTKYIQYLKMLPLKIHFVLKASNRNFEVTALASCLASQMNNWHSLKSEIRNNTSHKFSSIKNKLIAKGIYFQTHPPCSVKTYVLNKEELFIYIDSMLCDNKNASRSARRDILLHELSG